MLILSPLKVSTAYATEHAPNSIWIHSFTRLTASLQPAGLTNSTKVCKSHFLIHWQCFLYAILRQDRARNA